MTGPTLAAVDHDHPHDDEAMTDAYRRGPARRPAGDRAADPPTLSDVDHVPPDGLRPTVVFESGGRTTDEGVGGPASD